jgi:hypothetical protein
MSHEPSAQFRRFTGIHPVPSCSIRAGRAAPVQHFRSVEMYNPYANPGMVNYAHGVDHPGYLGGGVAPFAQWGQHGADAFAQQQQQQKPPPQGQAPDDRRRVAAQRQKQSEVTPKITGDSPVLPAKQKAYWQQLAEQQLAEQEQQRAQQQMMLLAAHGQLQPEAPKRSPEEQREYDATVDALRNELESTSIHMAVLEARRAKLTERLAAMGEEVSPSA